MRTRWGLTLAVFVLVVLAAAQYALTPRPSSDRALLAALQDELRFAYHGCVPLGWYPVPVKGTYYPGYTAAAQTYAEWLDAIWRGRIPAADLRRHDARTVFRVLNHLVSAGLLRRKRDSSGFAYFMTPSAFPYFYASSVFKDNRDSLPYLCYSTIVPQRIEWTQAMSPSAVRRAHGAQWYHVRFAWKPSPPAAWANDPVIRAHSVDLAPLTSPTTARVFYEHEQWYVANVYDRGWMLPSLSAPAGR